MKTLLFALDLLLGYALVLAGFTLLVVLGFYVLKGCG